MISKNGVAVLRARIEKEWNTLMNVSFLAQNGTMSYCNECRSRLKESGRLFLLRSWLLRCKTTLRFAVSFGMAASFNLIGAWSNPKP